MYLLAVTVYHFLPVNCEYEPMLPELMQYYPPLSPNANTITKALLKSLLERISSQRDLIHLHFRPQCATQQLTFDHKHRELVLLSQVRDQRALNKIKNLIWYCFALLLHLLEICSIDQFLCTFILTIMSSFVVCPLISFRVRKSIAAFGAFLFHI